jgi:hypothetical protein
MPDEVSLIAIVEATVFTFYFTTSVSVHFSFQESVTQKHFFGNYTSLVDSKKDFKVSLNAQYNSSVRLHGVKNMVLPSCRRRRKKPVFTMVKNIGSHDERKRAGVSDFSAAYKSGMSNLPAPPFPVLISDRHRLNAFRSSSEIPMSLECEVSPLLDDRMIPYASLTSISLLMWRVCA